MEEGEIKGMSLILLLLVLMYLLFMYVCGRSVGDDLDTCDEKKVLRFIHGSE